MIFRRRFRTARARGHSADYYLFILGKPLKTTHLQKRA